MALGYLLMTFSGNAEILREEIMQENNIFLKSLKINEQKLIEPGIYMREFH